MLLYWMVSIISSTGPPLRRNENPGYAPEYLDFCWKLCFELLIPGRLYAVGGCDENNFRLNSVESYNPVTDNWQYVAPMSTCRSSPCVMATGRALYVVGGVNYVGMSLNSGECFDPMTNTWVSINPMQQKRASACGAVCNGKIFVIGG